MNSAFSADSRVRLTKLEESRPGPLPVGYWLEGMLLDTPIVGRPIEVARDSRAPQGSDEQNVVKRLGAFISSNAEEILEQGDRLVVKTRNSTWEITPITP
jgi:hypothetical protein